MCNLEGYPLKNRSLKTNRRSGCPNPHMYKLQNADGSVPPLPKHAFKCFTENAAPLVARLNVQDVIDAREKTISCKRPFDAARILQSKSHPMGICPIVRKLS